MIDPPHLCVPKNWKQQLTHWIETQHGTAGWEMKLENFISSLLIKEDLSAGGKTEIYRAMDSFLVEAKDQNGNERSVERLNQDRHLFVEKMQEIISSLLHSKAEEVRGLEIDENDLDAAQVLSIKGITIYNSALTRAADVIEKI